MACSQESQPTMNISAMKTWKTASHDIIPAKPSKQCTQAYEVGCKVIMAFCWLRMSAATISSSERHNPTRDITYLLYDTNTNCWFRMSATTISSSERHNPTRDITYLLYETNTKVHT